MPPALMKSLIRLSLTCQPEAATMSIGTTGLDVRRGVALVRVLNSMRPWSGNMPFWPLTLMWALKSCIRLSRTVT